MFSPMEVAQNLIGIGKKKASTPAGKLFVLGLLAGMFIAFAAVGANTASCTVENGSLGRLLSALVFPGGLAMVLVAGSELFTGNTLIMVAVLEKEASVANMLRNWLWVYIGNFIGSCFVAALVCWGGQFDLFGGALGVTAIKVATFKCSLGFGHALLLGIGCNFLVCIAVWMNFAAKDVVGKIAGLFFPIMLFVLSGFEHSVANMCYIPMGLFAKLNSGYLAAAVDAGVAVDNLTWGTFLLENLLPVTIGNIIAGSFMVGIMYWYSYLKKDKIADPAS